MIDLFVSTLHVSPSASGTWQELVSQIKIRSTCALSLFSVCLEDKHLFLQTACVGQDQFNNEQTSSNKVHIFVWWSVNEHTNTLSQKFGLGPILCAVNQDMWHWTFECWSCNLWVNPISPDDCIVSTLLFTLLQLITCDLLNECVHECANMHWWSHPMLSPSLSLESVFFELWPDWSFCQTVGIHQLSIAFLDVWPAFWILFLVMDMLPEEMALCVEMLGPLRCLLTCCQQTGTLIIFQGLCLNLHLCTWKTWLF